MRVDPDYLKRVSANIRAQMKRAGISQAELQRRGPWSYAVINRWVRGVRLPTDAELQELARLLGCHKWDLTGEVSEVSQQLVDLWMDVSDLLMSGRNSAEALARATGEEVPEEKRDGLAIASPVFRENLSQLAGQMGVESWDLLTPAQKRQIALYVIEWARENREQA